MSGTDRTVRLKPDTTKGSGGVRLQPDVFAARHIGPRPADRNEMLRTIGVASLDALMDEAIPPSIRLERPLDLPPGETEHEYLDQLRAIASMNRVCKSYIGMGYYDCITPAVILRNVLENPGWYTPYTPYQAEIAQGRLESLLTFQTMVGDLTGMEIATASLLDEGTAAAEAMTMLYRVQQRSPGPRSPEPRRPGGASSDRNVFLASRKTFPQTLDVVRGRAEPLGIDVRVTDVTPDAFDDQVFGALVQYPDDEGAVVDLRPIVNAAHGAGARVAVASDLLALTLLTPPGEMDADVVVGNSQRFGVPMGYGGPHAAFFATRETFIRQAPGRIIGVSIDAHGQRAYRMTLQTREQHIRREKATSNICTAQALLANMAAMYAVYHGPEGLTAIAQRVHAFARRLASALEAVGIRQLNAHYFDTLCLAATGFTDRVRHRAVQAGLNFRYFDDGRIGIALDETTTEADLDAIAKVFANGARHDVAGGAGDTAIPSGLQRTSAFLAHPVFNTHRSEIEMMRYIRSLERKDIGLDTSMIPLGSCTMKLNAAAEMIPITWPTLSELHPFAPADQAAGYRQIFDALEAALREITSLAAVSLQPNSGAQGELAGLMAIRAYHRDRGDASRDVVLIPASAHGTNPASATMAGMRVVVVACEANGNVDVEDLRRKAVAHAPKLAALMLTYPSTYGVFEEAVREVCQIVHAHGGQVYMDGANMNAQVGLTSPAAIGADVCHLNLHKTFAIPHGGGGPGMGPIAVASHLAPYLPGHPVVTTGGARAIPAVAAAPWGSASILVISYGYIRMLGADGMTDATKHAILNANYLKARLETHYDVLYANHNGRVAHEMIFDLRPFKQGPAAIDEQDVAKRLMDYGFHAPTVSFPVPGTMMIEPTESESKAELDRFCDALVAIRAEIQTVMDGKADPKDNVLKNAPHPAAEVAANEWTHPYSREQAAFPLPFVRANKFWPPVARIDNPYGDRNLMCVCPPVETYAD